MSFNIDEVQVYKGQLLVCDDEIIPQALGVGEKKITGSAFLQGPVQIGDDGSYSEVEATLISSAATAGPAAHGDGRRWRERRSCAGTADVGVAMGGAPTWTSKPPTWR